MSRSRFRDHAIDLRPLAVPEFRRLWTSALTTAVGGSFAVVAVPTQLFTLTGSSAAVAASSIVSFGALLVSALVGGALADAVDRRRLLLVAHSGLALTYLLFWLQALAGVGSLPLMLVLAAAQGLGLGTIMTTMGAVVPRVVPSELLTAAISLSSMARWVGPIAGPMLAGVLIPVLGLPTLYLLDSVALLSVLWAVYRLPPILPSHRAEQALFRQVPEGFRYLAAQPVLLMVMGLDFAAMAFGMPYSLFPEMAQDVFGGGSGALGLLYAAYPVGVLAVGLMSGTFTRTRRHGAWMAGAAAAWGFSQILFGLAPHLVLGLGALMLGGGVNFVLSTFRNAITQEHTDDALRGRIQGALTVLLIGGPQLAGVLHGFASPLIGPRATVCAGGLLTLLAAAAVPRLWRYVPGR